ncbi:MAG: type II toxin-antitoxin system prevent-host-death family antitoxin [Actinomycetales bacterium]|nr:MAG: type II toxin-antitoxin system prevent-host-death family antitoxin [Actinomycetales bacterium]
MVSEVPVRDLRNHSADVLRRVASGEHLTVTRDGEPVAALRPLRRRPQRTADLIDRRAKLPPFSLAALRADLDDVLDPSL